jgi:hypothetical protein
MPKQGNVLPPEPPSGSDVHLFLPFTDTATGIVNWPLPPPRRIPFTREDVQRMLDPATFIAITGQKGHEWLYLFNKHEEGLPQKIVLEEGLQRLDELLFPYGIIRVHNSFLVNLAFIKERKGNELVLLPSVGEVITISRNRVAFFERALELYCMPPTSLPTIA